MFISSIIKKSLACDNEQQIKYEIAKSYRYIYHKYNVRLLVWKNKSFEKAKSISLSRNDIFHLILLQNQKHPSHTLITQNNWLILKIV